MSASSARSRTASSSFWVLVRLAFRQTVRGAIIVALVFGIFFASKSIGFIKAYPTAHARASAIASLASSSALAAIFGIEPAAPSPVLFAVWNCFLTMVMIGSIWSFITVSRLLRGNEELGITDMLLAQPTSRVRYLTATLSGFALALCAQILVATLCFAAVSTYPDLHFSFLQALYFAVAASSGAWLFAGIAALASQLWPTRAGVLTASAAVFMVAFALRAAGDLGAKSWLNRLSPLGWSEQLGPLGHTSPDWLAPLGLLTASLVLASLVLTGRRDTGDAFMKDRDTAKPHFELLGTSLGINYRLTRLRMMTWALGAGLVGLFYASITSTGVKVFAQSHQVGLIFERWGAGNAGARTWLGFCFFLVILALMAAVVVGIGSLHSDEARGYLDHFLSRSVSKFAWYIQRLFLLGLELVGAAALAGLAIATVVGAQNIQLSANTYFTAALNCLPPALLLLGITALVFGLRPRLTTTIGFAVLAWAFLLLMLSSGLMLNHWIMDTSILSHVALAPGSAPRWGAARSMSVIGLLLCAAGGFAFVRRDVTLD